MKTSFFLIWPLLLSTAFASPTVHFVDLNSTNPVSPYADWSTAATNIQDAVNACQTGEQVLVASGIYKFGGLSIFQIGPVTNRVVLTNAITVASVNGPEVTVLWGNQNPGPRQYTTRCAYVGSNSVLSGFTLTNGASCGAYCEPGGVISNCIITGCSGGNGSGVYRGTVYNSLITGNVSGANSGAGAFGSILYNCTLSNNYANGQQTLGGGGAYNCTLYNCLLVSNSTAWQGGAAASSTLYNCTVIGNSATNAGGGLAGSSAYNSIIYFNSCGNFPNTYLVSSGIIMGRDSACRRRTGCESGNCGSCESLGRRT